MASDYPLKISNCTICQKKAKEKWDT